MGRSYVFGIMLLSSPEKGFTLYGQLVLKGMLAEF